MAFLSTSYSNSQTIDPTTGELVNFSGIPTSTTSNWNNAGSVGQQLTCWGPGGAGYCGALPRVSAWGTGSNVINFSNGLTDLNQMVNISNAIASANGSTTGINITGFKFSFTAKNGNGWDDSRLDQLNAYVKLYDSTNTTALENYNYDLNRKFGWTNFAYNETFAAARAVNTVGNAQYGFIGKDNNNLIGPYGPEIINVSFSLKYKVDPCSLNPAYSSTCSGFGNILNSTNLLDSTRGGTSLTQAFAINTALTNAGIGAMVHGFNYGFNYRVGESWSGCTATNQDGSCSWYMDIPGRVNATVSLTNSSNQSIFSKNYNLTGDGTSGSISDKYLLPSSLNQALLGSGRIAGSTSGTGSRIEGMWATLIYTPDPCTSNPLYSTDCKGYATAYAKNMLLGSTVASASAPGPAPAEADPALAQSAPALASPDPAQPQQQQQSSGVVSGAEQPAGAPPPAPVSPQPASNSNPGATPANQPPPQGGSSQPKIGEVKTAGDNKSTSSPSLSSVMNMISSNQARIGNEAKSVVQAAEAQATQAATAAQQQAETVVGTAVVQSTSSSTTGGSTGSGGSARTSTQTQVSAFALPTGVTSTISSIETMRPPAQAAAVESTPSTGNGLIINSMPYQYNSLTTQSSIVSAVDSPVLNFGFQLPTGRTTFQLESEAPPQFEGIKIGTRSTLNDAMEQRPMLLNATAQEQRTETVNRNVQNNELAGGVDLRTMATQPAGYQAYSTAMPDVAFYTPKEIYKNQVNVDNVKLLRGLGSDRLHQEMVNQQYKIGN